MFRLCFLLAKASADASGAEQVAVSWATSGAAGAGARQPCEAGEAPLSERPHVTSFPSLRAAPASSGLHQQFSGGG